MKKIISIILTIIITSISFTQIAYAARGDLRYKIMSMNITEDKIKFKGWAFIHDSDNYRTIYKIDENGKIDYNKKIKENGGQKVKIRVYNENNSLIKEVETDCIEDKSSTNNYNFFYEMYTQSDTGTYGNNFKACYNSGNPKKCNNNNQYYYEDMYFEVEIPVSEISGNNVYFTISVFNNDYKWSKERKMGVTKDAISNNTERTIEVKNITTKLDMIASYAYAQEIKANGGSLDYYFNWYNDTKRSNCKSDKSCKFTIVDYNHGNYKSGYKKYVTSDYTKFAEGIMHPGKYALCIETKNNPVGDGCSGYNNEGFCICKGRTVAAFESWVDTPLDASITVNIPSDKKCPTVNPSKGDLNCNDNLTLEAKCNELTVKKNGSRANVEILQTGTISSVLTPNKIYAGGGFNLGIIYYNTISWSCVNGYTCDGNIKSAMKDKLKSNFQDSINLKGIKFNGKTIDSSLFVKKCQTTGSFTNGNTLTTVCTFFLPKSTIDKDGKVKYGVGNDLGINNKYYTSLDDKGKYNIELTITGMDRLTENSTKNDSKENKKSWTGSWEKEFNNCSIKVYSLLAEPTTSKTLKYKPIYRPIDLNNPFPDRNAGVNWYEWYKIPNNKKRLEESYGKLQYQITLDNQTVVKIKNYNSSHNYLDWDGINKDTKESDFIDTYFTTKRQNIVGDDS